MMFLETRNGFNEKKIVETFLAALIKIHCCLQRLDSERSFNNFFHKQFALKQLGKLKNI